MKSIYEIDADGNKFWRNPKGQLHREDGPAVEYASGTKYWYQNNKKYREDGPAVEFVDVVKWWYKNGHRHRLDGPAIEWADGDKEWWINGVELTEQEVLIMQRKLKFNQINL